MPASFNALAHRDFSLFVAVCFFTNVGAQTQGVAVGWDLYERTGSALALGFVGLANFLPVLLLFIPAGQIADRYDRRRIMEASLAVWALGAAALAGAALLGAEPFWLYVGCVLTSVANVLHRPARDALLPQLVPVEMLPSAVAWNSSVFQVASVAGPALAGIAIAATGSAASVYIFNTGAMLLSVLLAALIRARGQRVARAPVTMAELFAGMAHVWKTKVVLGVLVLDMFAVLLGGASALLPVYAKDILHVGPAALGWLSAAPAIGAFCMALYQGTSRRPIVRPGRTFFWAVAGYGLATVVFGFSELFWLSFIALALTGVLDNIGVVIRMTVVQLHTPDELRGRVSAVNRVFVSSSNELGALESGLLANFTNPVFTVVAGGIATVLIALAAAKVFPDLRKLKTLAPP